MPLPLLAVAAGVGALRAGLGIAGARKQKHRGLNQIREAYGLQSRRLSTQQADTRQDTLEGVNRRGLLGMTGAVTGGMGAERSGTVGTQVQTDLEQEFGTEREALDMQRRHAVADTKGAASQAIIGAITGGVDAGMHTFAAGKSLQSMRGPKVPDLGAPPPLSVTPSAQIRGAYGISPIDPQITSSIVAQGQDNLNFRVR